MSTYEKSNGGGNSLVNLLIGLSVLAFLGIAFLIVIGVVLSIIFALIPIFGIGLAIWGGGWFLTAKNDHYRMRAAMLFGFGVLLLMLTAIF